MNLKLEIDDTIDVGEHFLKATYFLEGVLLLTTSKQASCHSTTNAKDFKY